MDREKQKELVRRRRSQKRRARYRWLRIVKYAWNYNVTSDEYRQYGEDFFDALLGQVRRGWKNRKRCSCVMCGNPRRHFGLITIQEQRHLDQMSSEFDEWSGVREAEGVRLESA